MTTTQAVPPKVLKLDPKDNVVVALADLSGGESVELSGATYIPVTRVPAKHKFAATDFPAGAEIIMYGVVVGRTREPIPRGTQIAEKMSYIIDIDTGSILSGETTIEQAGETILDRMLEVASGRQTTKAEKFGQNDFIPWKRGISL